MRMRMLGNQKRNEPAQGNQTYNPQSNSYSQDKRRSGYDREHGTPNGERRNAQWGYGGHEQTRRSYDRPEWEDGEEEWGEDPWEDEEEKREKRKKKREREEKGRKAIKAGGTFWMGEEEDEDEPITKEEAEKWVKHMKGEDSKGEKWSMEDLKAVAQKNGIPIDGEKFLEFYVMMNAMYTDYGEVAKKYNINNPDFFAALTKAWMNDKDATENKTKKYFEKIVKK